MTPQEIVDRALALARSEGCIVIVDEGSSANLRWASNTLTTNGVMATSNVTVIATVDGAEGTASGVMARSAVSEDDIEPLVRAAEQSARDSGPAEDVQPLVADRTSADWDQPPAATSIDVFADLSPALGDTLRRAQAEGSHRYGYVEHDVGTRYLASSSGLRLRHVQPGGHIGITGKAPDLSASAWVGQGTRDFADVDITALDDELGRRLGWAANRVELPAGRYDTVLPPSAVADLMTYAWWNLGARDAMEGRSVFSKPGGGTRVGERLSPAPVSLRSNPHEPGLECAGHVTAHASSSQSSVFDNGLPTSATAWINEGALSALVQTRHTAELTGLPVTPRIGNLVLDVPEAQGTTDDLATGVERGLMLTCLWYIREVDPQTLLLTGLTRDGVYLVEGGDVVGAVNNFRFNESPVDLLTRFTEAGSTSATLGREFGDYMTRTAMPPLRVPDFNMSTVSDAS